MGIELHLARLAGTESYSWTVPLQRPMGSARHMPPSAMNASELMFFFGAPLAHVLAYEEDLRAARRGNAQRALNRARRPANFVVPLEELLPEAHLLLVNEG